jgi:hypothetical protein
VIFFPRYAADSRDVMDILTRANHKWQTCGRLLSLKSICDHAHTHLFHQIHMSTMFSTVRATSDNRNKQKAKGNLRYIYVMNEYVHT